MHRADFGNFIFFGKCRVRIPPSEYIIFFRRFFKFYADSIYIFSRISIWINGSVHIMICNCIFLSIIIHLQDKASVRLNRPLQNAQGFIALITGILNNIGFNCLSGFCNDILNIRRFFLIIIQRFILKIVLYLILCIYRYPFCVYRNIARTGS